MATRHHRDSHQYSPFEDWLLLGCVVQGAAVLAGIADPQILVDALGNPLRVVWSIGMTVGGILALLGTVNVGAYRVGLALVATATGTYGTALILHGSPGYVAAVLNLSVTIACITQISAVTRELENARAYMGPYD